MRYGFLSDVHGDLTGCQRALQFLRGTDVIYFLGDSVGGSNDLESIQMLRDANVLPVLGNHDLWELKLDRLPLEAKDYLGTWPFERPFEDCLAVHTKYLIQGERTYFPYILTEDDARRAFQHFSQRLIFFGHTHRSQVYALDPDGQISLTRVRRNCEIDLRPGTRYLVNVGAAPDWAVIYDHGCQKLHFLDYQALSLPDCGTYGFLSDVQGNATFCRAALKALADTHIVCFLGDVLGGVDDIECTELLRSVHAFAVAGDQDRLGLTNASLPRETCQYLESWPLEIQFGECMAVHSDYIYEYGEPAFPAIHSEADARRAFERFPHRVVFFGHTQLSQIHQLTAEGRIFFFKPEWEQDIPLDPAARYLLNVGSQPPAVLFYDAERSSVRYSQVEQ